MMYKEDMLIYLGIIFVVGFILIISIFGFNQPTSGVKIGQVLSIENSGIINKTNELSIARGGLSNGSGTVANITHVTASQEFVPALNLALSSQKEVEVIYNCPLYYLHLKSDSGCFIDKIITH